MYIYRLGRHKGPGSEGEGAVAKTFRCADAGLNCRFEARGQDDQEVLEAAVEHARKKHGVDLTQAQTLVRFAQGAVRDEDAGAGRRAG